jgi:sensor domain CHASE-containing protein
MENDTMYLYLPETVELRKPEREEQEDKWQKTETKGYSPQGGKDISIFENKRNIMLAVAILVLATVPAIFYEQKAAVLNQKLKTFQKKAAAMDTFNDMYKRLSDNDKKEIERIFNTVKK